MPSFLKQLIVTQFSLFFSFLKIIVGYIFFDVFNQNQVQNPIFKSKKFGPKEGEVSSKCLTFWFSPFGRSEVTQLSVYQSVEGSTGDADIGETAPASSVPGGDGSSGRKVLLWQIQTRKFDTRRPQWYFGQTTVNAATPHEITFEGEALDGGFAVDDITFYDGNCQSEYSITLLSSSGSFLLSFSFSCSFSCSFSNVVLACCSNSATKGSNCRC